MNNRIKNAAAVGIIALLMLPGSLLWAQRNGTISDSYLLETEGKYAQAIAIMTRLEIASPNDPFYKLRLGWLNFLLQDYHKAEAYYRQSLQLLPSLEAREGIMNSHYYRGNWQKTIDSGTAILELYPQNFTALTAVAFSYYSLSDYRQAADYYYRSSLIYPHNLEVMGYLLSSYHLAGEKEKARGVYRKLSLYSPDNRFVALYRSAYGR